jgi:hypothetical protein
MMATLTSKPEWSPHAVTASLMCLLRVCPQVWSELDPDATHFIPAIQLSTLIQELQPPLGVKGEEGARAKIQGIIMNVDIPIRDGKVRGAVFCCVLTRRGRTAGCC